MTDEAGAHADAGWRDREKNRMTSPVDTIREALVRAYKERKDSSGEAMDALTEVEQQLANANARGNLADAHANLARAVAAEAERDDLQRECGYLAKKNVAAETALAEKDTECADWYGKALAAQHDQEQAERRANALADALLQIQQYATMCDASGGLPSSVRLREVARAALDRHTHHDEAVT